MADGLSLKLDASAFERKLDQAEKAFAAGEHRDLEDGQRGGAAAYLAFLRQLFLTAGNGTWTPLAEATVKEKQRKGEDPRPGFSNGAEMFNSLTPGHPNNVLDVRGLQTVAGSADPVMSYFHHGTSRGMPPRPVFVEPDAAAQADIAAAQADGVAKCLADIFGRG